MAPAKVVGGQTATSEPGDVVIIVNTPHWFTETRRIRSTYLVVRVDPHKVLPAGCGSK